MLDKVRLIFLLVFPHYLFYFTAQKAEIIKLYIRLLPLSNSNARFYRFTSTYFGSLFIINEYIKLFTEI